MKRKERETARKTPRQARSRQTKADIVEGAIRVLARPEAAAFSTVRVAAEAGVSVGSLYQYFPDKESVLLGVHDRELAEAWAIVQDLLADETRTHAARLRRLAAFYFEAEAGEDARVRGAAVQARDAREASDAHAALWSAARARIRVFLAEAPLSREAAADLDLATDLVMTTIERLGHAAAERGLDRVALRRWSDGCAEMVCRYLGLA